MIVYKGNTKHGTSTFLLISTVSSDDTVEHDGPSANIRSRRTKRHLNPLPRRLTGNLFLDSSRLAKLALWNSKRKNFSEELGSD